MHPIKEILVALDFSETDKTLLEYASMLNHKLSLNKFFFVHVTKKNELPPELKNQFPELFEQPIEKLTQQLLKEVSEHFPNEKKVPFEAIVAEGNAEKEVLKIAKAGEVDLIITGRKPIAKGSGLLSRKLSKSAHCNVIELPENPPEDLQKIIVPVDYSEKSKEALEVAQFISNQIDHAALLLLNVYKVPMGYYTSGKSYQEFAEIMKQNSQKQCARFMEQCEFLKEPTHMEFVLDDDENPAKAITEFAKKHEASLLVVGSKGRTGAADFLMGSTAEKLLQYNEAMPVMVVKNKEENLGFLDALLRL